MANALQHSRNRRPGMVNLDLAYVPTLVGLIFHTDSSPADSDYEMGWSKSGGPMWYDLGDGTVGSDMSGVTHAYAGTGVKTVQLWPGDDWSGFTRFNSNDHQNLGAFPSFAACINLVELRFDDNTGITGSLPSFNVCTLLEELHINVPQFTGVIPTFHNCTHLVEVYIPMNVGTGFTGYTSGSFNNQANLYSLSFYGSSLPQADIDALLADLVTSLSLGGRVTCSVTLTGGSNASPSSMTNHDILEAAGWTVDVN